MDVTLSDMEYFVLISSLHTKDIPTIAQSILRVEKILYHMRLLLAAQGSALASLQINDPVVQVGVS